MEPQALGWTLREAKNGLNYRYLLRVMTIGLRQLSVIGRTGAIVNWFDPTRLPIAAQKFAPRGGAEGVEGVLRYGAAHAAHTPVAHAAHHAALVRSVQ